LIEKVSEVDDTILEKYLHGRRDDHPEDESGGDPGAREQLGARKGERRFGGHLRLAFKNKACTAARCGRRFLPSPLDVPSSGPSSRQKGSGRCRSEPDRSPGGRRCAVSALAFKT